MFESTIELSVSVTSKEAKELLWTEFQKFAQSLTDGDLDVRIGPDELLLASSDYYSVGSEMMMRNERVRFTAP